MPRRLVSPTLVGRAPELAAVALALDGAAAGAPSITSSQAKPASASHGWSERRWPWPPPAGCGCSSGAAPTSATVACPTARRRGAPVARPGARRRPARNRDRDRRPDLARLVPSLSPTLVTDFATQGESLQARLLDALLGVLQRLSEISPVMFVVEDLHWADPATRETIAFLIRHLRTDRVVLVMTFRADELHRRHPLLPWLAELERSGRVERIDLERLDQAQTGELLTAIIGAPPSPRPRRADPSSFRGQPVLRRGASRGRRGRWRRPPAADPARGPPGSDRWRCRSRAQAVIGVAAVAGRRVDHDLLAARRRDGRRGPPRGPADGGRQPGAGDRIGRRRPRRRLCVPARAAPGSGLRRPPAGRAPAAASRVRRGARRADPRQRRRRRRALGGARLPLGSRTRRPTRLRGVDPGR